MEGPPGLTYLGTILNADWRIGSELGRRIGCAKREFKDLCKVWNHSNLSQTRKLNIYQALVESKLLYGLSCCCLSAAELRRLNGFQAKCLRQILKIRPAYYSRVSNQEGLRRAGPNPAAELLLRQQLNILGKVLRAPQVSPLHTAAVVPGTLQPATSYYIRRVGRPRKEWVASVMQAAHQRSAGCHDPYRLAQGKSAWQQCMKR